MTRAKVNDMIRHTETYDTLHAGKVTVTGVKQALANLPNTRMWQILVQNSPTSGATVYVGNDAVQPFELVAGADVTIPVDRTNKIFIIGTAGDRVNWLAMG